MRDYYEILGLSRSASGTAVKNAYRELSKRSHPDVNSNSAEANVRMQEVNEAYRILSAPLKRAQYDQLLHLREQTGDATDPTSANPENTGHCRCEKCGRFDVTLRVTVFTWVVSLLVISYRRGWAKVLCARCRTKFALLFDLQNFLMGWWGFPFGLFWTVEALCRNSMGGEQPAENNALFLAGLGYELSSRGHHIAALEALEASLKLKDEPRVKAFYNEIKPKTDETQPGSQPQPRPSVGRRFVTGAFHPALYCFPLIALLFWLGHLLLAADKHPHVAARSTGAPHYHSSQSEPSSDPVRQPTADTAEAQLEMGARFENAYATNVYAAKKEAAEENRLEALKWLQKAAQQGLHEAEFRLADMLSGEASNLRTLSPEGTRDAAQKLAATKEAEAFMWFRKAAERGHLGAQSALAHRLWCGPTSDSPPAPMRAEALKWYRKAAEQSSSEAQFELAERLAELARPAGGTNRTGDSALEAESLSWYRKAAQQGDGEAQCRLASRYEERADYLEAAKWYKMAVAQLDSSNPFPERGGSNYWKIVGLSQTGVFSAIEHLAEMYDEGHGVPQDHVEAAKLLRQATGFFTYNDIESYAELLVRLGEKFEAGLGVREDQIEAYKWFEVEAIIGQHSGENIIQKLAKEKRASLAKRLTPAQISEAQTESTVYLAYHTPGQEGFIKFLTDAENGNAEAQYKLAIEYYVGNGRSSENYIEAALWFRKAAQQGHAGAQLRLGELCLEGKGVTKNPDLAAMYFGEAAENGDSWGQYHLGLCYANGVGVPKNLVASYKWFSIALASTPNSAFLFRDKVESCVAQLAPQLTAQQIALGQRFAAEYAQRNKHSTATGGRDSGATESVKSTGSGFFISDDGSLVTNFHVVEGASRLAVKTRHGNFAAKVLKVDRVNDIAILKVSGSGFRWLPLASSRGVRLGESVFTIGFPNPELQGIEPKLTDGKISSLAGAHDDGRYFQISVAVQPGNSGGGLLNYAGNVVGMVTARLSDEAALESSGALPQNVNYALKGSYILSLLESVPEISGRLREPQPGKERKFEDVVKEGQEAAALVLAY